MSDRLPSPDHREIVPGVLVDRERAVLTGRRRHQLEGTTPLRLGKDFLLIAGPEPLLIRQEPDLVEMNPLPVRGVELTVAHARAGAHVLKLTGTQDGAVAETVPVLERSFQDVSDDLHVAVAMHPEARTGLHPVVVDDTQG